jgi:hypothetical protein
LKLSYQNILRRLPIQETLTYEELKNYSKQLFPQLNEIELTNELQFAWVDDENDCVTISSNLELEEAIRVMRLVAGKGSLRFEVRPESQSGQSFKYLFIDLILSFPSRLCPQYLSIHKICF